MMDFFRKNVRGIMMVVVMLFVVSCFSMYGGRETRNTDGGAQSDRDRPVATINGQQIMLSQIDLETARALRYGNYGQVVSEDEIRAIRAEVLDSLALQMEIENEIKARGIGVSAEELAMAVKEQEDRAPTKEIFLQHLQSQGLTESQFSDIMRQHLLTMKLYDVIAAPASADESEKVAYYDTFKSFSYVVPEGYDISFARFKTEASASSAYASIGSGADWDAVLDAVSDDVTSKTSGDQTVFMPVSDMRGVYSFISEATEGRLSAPREIASDDLLMVIKRTHHEERIMSYDEVSADVEAMIIGQKQNALIAQFNQEMMSRADVKRLDPDIFPIAAPASDAAELAVSADISLDTTPVSK